MIDASLRPFQACDEFDADEIMQTLCIDALSLSRPSGLLSRGSFRETLLAQSFGFGD
jgi:hypothetical protein